MWDSETTILDFPLPFSLEENQSVQLHYKTHESTDIAVEIQFRSCVQAEKRYFRFGDGLIGFPILPVWLYHSFQLHWIARPRKYRVATTNLFLSSLEAKLKGLFCYECELTREKHSIDILAAQLEDMTNPEGHEVHVNVSVSPRWRNAI